MKAKIILPFFYRLQSHLRQINWINHDAHELNLAATQRESNAARILHQGLIQIRSRRQSL